MATFTPPTVQEGPAGGGPLFWRYKLQRGETVIKRTDGSYVTVRFPDQGTLSDPTVATYYLGGYSYTITSTEAAALTAAGYGAYIS